MNGKQIRIVRDEPWSLLKVYIKNEVGNKQEFANKVVFEEVGEAIYVDPLMHIGFDAGQRLMDDLWEAGLRPSEGTGSAGALFAVQKHLDDMRKIVFKFIDNE
jgi:hypothetical protein